MAYCLLGLFDVNMPLLYGEGSKVHPALGGDHQGLERPYGLLLQPERRRARGMDQKCWPRRPSCSHRVPGRQRPRADRRVADPDVVLHDEPGIVDSPAHCVHPDAAARRLGRGAVGKLPDVYAGIA
ncbi:hypothetical protein F4804DRAFT_335432 [Jackrogersella minutella]|nr:hypothetical protein F4804DRAFT_335432 [Jackrogersella minutella]